MQELQRLQFLNLNGLVDSLAVVQSLPHLLQRLDLHNRVVRRNRILGQTLQQLVNAFLSLLLPSQVPRVTAGDRRSTSRCISRLLLHQRLPHRWIGFPRVEVPLGIPDPLSATSQDLKVLSQSLGAGYF